MLDAVESELPGHVEDMEFQVSFSGLRCATAVLEQLEKVDGCGLVLDGQSEDEMGAPMTRLQGVENSLA